MSATETAKGRPVSDARFERWWRRAVRALNARDYEAAGRACLRLLELYPDAADAVFMAAVCELERGRPGSALAGLERAASLAPHRADILAQYARCLAMLGRHEAALDVAGRATAALRPESREPLDALTHDTLGAVLTRIGRFGDAARHFEAAVGIAPGQPHLQYNYANGLLFCGEIAGARAAFESVVAMDPDHSRAHLALSDLLDGAPPPGRIESLTAALQRAAGDRDRELPLQQALARTLEAAGRTAEAFALWERGKSARKKSLGYTIEQDRRIFAAFERHFDAAAAADTRPGSASRAPIFVLGMPRTGTTLVDRILASHSAVGSAGELVCMPQAVREAAGGRGTRLIDPEAIAPALARDPAEIGERYLELARTVVGDAGRFVDKQPLNFFFIGFICRALPNAGIVCLRRGALDTCLASFRQLFALGFAYYRYALSPLDTAEYFAMFDRLMAHWQRCFPGRIYELQYERLVTDTEAEIRRLFDHLGLEFEDAVLQFDRNEAPVGTASAAQVRQPIHRRSIGAWRRYEKELEPVRRRLDELGLPAEYGTE